MSNQMAIRYMWWKDTANQWEEERKTVELCDNFCWFEMLGLLRAYSPRPEIETASVWIYDLDAYHALFAQNKDTHGATLFDGVVRFR